MHSYSVKGRWTVSNTFKIRPEALALPQHLYRWWWPHQSLADSTLWQSDQPHNWPLNPQTDKQATKAVKPRKSCGLSSTISWKKEEGGMHSWQSEHQMQASDSPSISTWVDGSPNDTSQRVPGAVIKPIVKVVEAFFCQEASGTVIEVWIKFMDHALKPQHREETSWECWNKAKKNAVLVTTITRFSNLKGTLFWLQTITRLSSLKGKLF